MKRCLRMELLGGLAVSSMVHVGELTLSSAPRARYASAG